MPINPAITVNIRSSTDFQPDRVPALVESFKDFSLAMNKTARDDIKNIFLVEAC